MNGLIRAESIRTLYAQARTTLAAALVITTYMVAAAWPYTPWPQVVSWAAAVLIVQVLREMLVRAFYRALPEADELERWAHLYTAHQFLTGLVWGATIFLFVHPEEPITVALTLCCLYSIASGCVPAQAYNPPTLFALILPLYTAILVRLLAVGTVGYALIGVTSALYGATMLGFCRVQARSIREGFRIRFENKELVEALRIEKVEAERAWRAAEAANLAKSQFLAAASHDLRQPLYALSLFSASLGSLKLDDDGRAVMNSIQGSVSTMESLFAGLLDVSRLDAGVVQARPAPTSVDLLFDRLSQVYHPIAVERGLALRFRSDGEWITTDVTLLEQVLSNLLSNALRYTDAGGVLVAARARAGTVRLEVWDTGRGVAAADQARIFDEFVQVENHERDRRKGLGLGLAIAQRSAALIGTRIQLKSRPHRGSCFSVVQPAARPVNSGTDLTQVSTRAHGTSVLARRGLPVLLVDDDRDVRLAFGHLLEGWHVPFDTAVNAADALELLTSSREYGTMLVDYRLSGELNGIELVLSMRRLPLDKPPNAILITGDFDHELIGAAKEYAIPILHKPVQPNKIREILGIEELPARQTDCSIELMGSNRQRPGSALEHAADEVEPTPGNATLMSTSRADALAPS